MRRLEAHWYSSRSSWMVTLLPLSWLFRSAVFCRRFLYQRKFKKVSHFPVPVIVVGNITLGGTGKTPLVIWLANFLKSQGFKPGIVSRGVGGKQKNHPRWVTKESLPPDVGDEAILLLRRTQCPLVIGINRVLAVSEILAKTDCNLIISDDGLQHYRLGRDIEIALIDSMRGLGNKHFLPAGPLREHPNRLTEVDFVIRNGEAMQLQGTTFYSLKTQDRKVDCHHFHNQTVHALAAIGNPNRFFNHLRSLGLQLIEHVFPDHYLYKAQDLCFKDNLPIIMTEKDAVKCFSFANEKCWYLPVEAKVIGLEDKLLQKLETIKIFKKRKQCI